MHLYDSYTSATVGQCSTYRTYPHLYAPSRLSQSHRGRRWPVIAPAVTATRERPAAGGIAAGRGAVRAFATRHSRVGAARVVRVDMTAGRGVRRERLGPDGDRISRNRHVARGHATLPAIRLLPRESGLCARCRTESAFF